MSVFWPKGIEISDTQSPMQILETARKDWEKNSGGVLTLLLQDAKSESGNDMIIVHAKHLPSERISTLFSVIYRPNSPYPATIQPKKDDLPNFLKKSYHQPSKARFAGQVGMAESLRQSVELLSDGKEVKNAWVSDEPSEFREKLEQVFNLSIVKSNILNLLSGFQGGTTNDDEESDSEYIMEN
jgi:hypothetical protein